MEPSDGPVPDAVAAPAPGAETVRLLDTARELLADLRALLHDQLHLLALEAERASQALANIAILSVAAGLLAACLWVGLSLALGFWLTELGLRTSLAVLLATGINGLGLWLVLHGIRHESHVLGFPGTLKSLQRLQKPLPPAP